MYLVILHVEDKEQVQQLRREQNVDAVYRLPEPGTETCDGYCGRGPVLTFGPGPRGFTVHKPCGKRWHVWNRLGRVLFERLGKNLLPNPPKMFQNPTIPPK